MKHLKLFSKTVALLIAVTVLALPARADRVVNQLQFGKQTIEVAADEVITFQDMKGYTKISSSSSNNSQSLTVFKPAEGMAIQITFANLDVRNDGANWPAYVNVYAGDPDADNLFSYATSTSGVTASSTLPTGTVLEKLDGTYENLTYTATDATGIISVGYLYRYAKEIKGWNATVKCVTLDDMTVTGASSNYDNVVASTTATEAINFATAQITATGIMKADVVTGITFKASTNENAIDPLQLRLYAGSQPTFAGATALDATVAADGDGYTFSLNQPLSDGINQFSIAGEFLGSAVPGAKAAIDITKIATAGQPDGISPFTAATAIAVAKPAIAMISTTPQVITVGEVPYNFYDDGGKDGNITQGFEGQITFVPATEGNAIKIDFSKLDLFNTSTVVGYNDVFKFYNGREVNEENLITTLLDEAEIVKSTAADGSMTVYLKSTAGYPKSGWEALVSQFLPGDMTLSGVTGEAASAATVAAGDKDAQMLVVDVMTDNTANPLSLKGINVSTTDAKNIARARAYYLGKKNTFATTDQLGEVEVSGTAIAINCEKELIEGHNYVAVVLDLNDQAQNGDVITLSLNDVIVGETTQAPAEAVNASRTVNNICRATQGSHSHVISGPWTFTNTEGYSGKYETVDTDYIVTFTPAEAGTVAQIDFSAFDVYYGSSSYSTQAVFEIYSGTEVNTSNLLWNLKDNSESKVGPGRILRSQSADGSLTIRFNPKTTSSYYAGTGWTATVQPFKNHDMEVKSITVNQTSTDVLAPGAASAALIDFNVETEGTLSLLTTKAVNLDLKNSQTAVSKVSVYYNNENNRENAVEFGSVENPETSAVVVNGERELAEGNNYFWVTVDVKADADAEAVVDAKLVSVTDAAGNVVNAENGDPDGERVVKYIYLLEEGNNVVVVTNPLMFYDDGGADGKVSKGFTGTVTFVPGRENCAIELNTQGTFSIGSGYMYVYNGQEANDDNLVARYGTTTGPAGVVSKAEDGSITVYYKGNTTASTLDGWAIAVSLHEKTPYVIEDVEATATTDDVNRSMSNALMQQLKVNVSGDKEPIAISSVKFTAAGTTNTGDIAAAKLYYTAHTANFSDANQVASLATVADGENVLTLDTPLEISDNGDYYLWLTYDVAPDAATGNKLAAQALSVSQGDNVIDVTGAAAEREVVAGIKGTYTIGTSAEADFPTFAAATAAMSNGVEGAVRFEVEDGTYAENIVISNVRGTSEQNTVTFVSKSGDRNKVIITGGGYSAPAYGELKKGMVFVETTPWVTFESMSFIPQSQSYPYAVHIYNQSRHFTLKDSYLKAEIVTSGYSGMNLFKSENVGTLDDKGGMNNDYLTIEDNEFYGGYIAISASGPGPVAVPDALNYTISNNKIAEARSKGIYITDVANAVINGNNISQSTSTATNYSSIDMYRNTGNAVISNNVIVHTHSYYSVGLWMRQGCEGTSENEPMLVYNNSIVITNAASNSVAGLQVTADSKNISLYNNTVRIAGEKGYAYYTAGSGNRYTGMKLQNNLLQNFTTSGNLAYINSADDAKALVMTNNALYAASGTLFENHAATIDDLNALDNKQGNIAEQAEFLSDIDNHLMSAGNLNMGLPVDFITTDADGLERDAQTPTVGAYEFAEIVEEKPEIAEGYPTVTDVAETTATIKSKWSVSGKLYYKVEEVTETPAGAPAMKAATADDLMAADAVDITADTEISTALTELTPATTYKAYLMVVSALGVQSDVVETEAFTTVRHIEPLMVEVDDVQTINAGEEATIESIYAGGDEPYTFEWRDQMNQVVGNEATLKVTPEYSYGYRLTVTSADGQTATAKTAVRVLGDAVTASMDDNYLAEESHWAYDATTQSSVTDGFYSGSYYFNNGAMPGYNYWYGYSLSNETATTYAALTDQWHSAVGEGHNGSANYVVAFPEGQFVEITNSADGDNLKGVYVSNSAYSYNGMKNGDGFATAFSQGSWFKLTAVGFDATGSETARTDFYLADYRSSNASDHYILDTWQWMDLRPLGKVAKVRFLLDGSDKGTYGLNTAAYFVMDDFNTERDMTEQTIGVPQGQSTISLYELFELTQDGSTISYAMEEVATQPAGAPRRETTVGNEMQLTLDENGIVSVNATTQNCEQTVIVSATQKGQTQYVKLTVNVDTSTNVRTIDADGQVQSVTYYNVAGMSSDKPFDGLNIVVTRYADGSQSTVKVVR